MYERVQISDPGRDPLAGLKLVPGLNQGLADLLRRVRAPPLPASPLAFAYASLRYAALAHILNQARTTTFRHIQVSVAAYLP